MNKDDTYYSLKITEIEYICSILIVILHSNNINGYGLTADSTRFGNFVISFENLVSVIGHVAVPTFFVISAYLFFSKYSDNIYLTKIKRKVYSLGVPYLFWNIVGFLFFAFLTYCPLTKNYMNQDAVDLRPWMVLWNIITSKYTPLWYVRNLFVYFLFAPVLYKVLKCKVSACIAMILNVAAVLYFKRPYYNLETWLPLFMIGSYIGINYKDIIIHWEKNRLSRKNKVLTCVVFFILYVFVIISNSEYHVLYLYRIFAPFFIWILFDLIIFNQNRRWWKEITFFIYCSHFFFVSVFQKLMLLLFGNGWRVAIIVYIITPILVCIILTMIAFFLKKHAYAIWKIMNGGR